MIKKNAIIKMDQVGIFVPLSVPLFIAEKDSGSGVAHEISDMAINVVMMMIIVYFCIFPLFYFVDVLFYANDDRDSVFHRMSDWPKLGAPSLLFLVLIFLNTAVLLK